jgi:tRNA A-37 threonylcarbamoyl transferase component Bud32
VNQAADLHEWIKTLETVDQAAARAMLIDRIDQLARLVRDMHAKAISHRDLKAANILVAANQLWLVDLVGVSRRRLLGIARKTQNLTRLNASFIRHPRITRTMKLRFLRAYLNWSLHGMGGWKTWWKRIAHATEEKEAQNGRRGRVLA